MEVLSSYLRKNGYEYNLITRSENNAIYSQSYENTIVGYEVFKIFIRGARYSDFLGKDLQPKERFPSNESFGYSAWVYNNLEDARRKYKDLELVLQK